MTCTHEVHEMDMAVADGFCPICLAAEIERLRAVLMDGWETVALFNVNNYHPTLVALQTRLLAGLEQKSL